MEKEKFLLPVGKEILVSSSVEAHICFIRNGINVSRAPVLGVVRQPKDYTKMYFVWMYENTEEEKNYVLSLFDNQHIPLNARWEYFLLDKGQLILYKNRYSYIVDFDKKLGICVKRIDFYWHEKYARQEANIRGFKTVKFMLCRMFLTSENSRLFSYCWVGYDEEKNAIIYIKLAEEDFEKMFKYSSLDFGREAVDVGEHIKIQGRCYELKSSQDGCLYLEEVYQNPYMRVVVRNY